MTKLDEVTECAMGLAESERASLAAALLSTLPSPFPETTDDEILEEARRREAEIASGSVQPISREELIEGVQRERRK